MDRRALERGGDAWGPSSVARQAGRAKTLADSAVQRIYADIVAGRLAPGERLKPDELRLRYKLGTSPIREALLKLSAEGLVQLEGQRGFRVPPTSVAELADIAEIRSTLSCLALRRSIARGDDAWEAAIVAAFHRMERLQQQADEGGSASSDEWEARNHQFHLALEAACDSPWLLHFSSVAYSQSERYRRHYVRYPDVLAKSQREHRAIMEAALARDAEAACRRLAAHITEGADLVCEAMQTRDARAAESRPAAAP